jgi:hypothetical protein
MICCIVINSGNIYNWLHWRRIKDFMLISCNTECASTELELCLTLLPSHLTSESVPRILISTDSSNHFLWTRESSYFLLCCILINTKLWMNTLVYFHSMCITCSFHVMYTLSLAILQTVGTVRLMWIEEIVQIWKNRSYRQFWGILQQYLLLIQCGEVKGLATVCFSDSVLTLWVSLFLPFLQNPALVHVRPTLKVNMCSVSPVVAWRYWEKQWKLSIRIAGFTASTLHLPPKDNTW